MKKKTLFVFGLILLFMVLAVGITAANGWTEFPNMEDCRSYQWTTNHKVMVKIIGSCLGTPNSFDYIARDATRFDNNDPYRWCEEGVLYAIKYDNFAWFSPEIWGRYVEWPEGGSVCYYPDGWIDSH